jgi:hypothetical protein
MEEILSSWRGAVTPHPSPLAPSHHHSPSSLPRHPIPSLVIFTPAPLPHHRDHDTITELLCVGICPTCCVYFGAAGRLGAVGGLYTVRCKGGQEIKCPLNTRGIYAAELGVNIYYLLPPLPPFDR